MSRLWRIGVCVRRGWAELNERNSVDYRRLYINVSGLCAALGAEMGLLAPPARGVPFLDAILVSRLVGAAASLGSVVLVGCIGARAFGPTVGILAAALFAVVPVDVLQVHFACV